MTEEGANHQIQAIWNMNKDLGRGAATRRTTKLHKTTAVTAVVSVLVWCVIAQPADAASRKLKVFILAGQSNMEGHAHVGTFDSIGKDPMTGSPAQAMRNPDGTPRVCDKV